MRSPFDRDIKMSELEPSEYYKALYPPGKGEEKAVAEKTADTAAARAGTGAPADSLHRLASVTTPADSLHPPAAVTPPAGTADTAKAAPQAAAADTSMYGKDVQIDFSNYVFKDTYTDAVPKDTTIQKLPKITENVDKDGHYRVNKYKLNFTPDIVYGNAGYDTFYGVTGSTVMAFSDLMGDHQIIFSTNLLLDLKNSDFALQYYYLPNRIDFGFGGFTVRASSR